jgi:methyltransferase
MTRALRLFAAAFAPMIGEAVLSARNERQLRLQGAVEPADDVYGAMRIAYPVAFGLICAEAWMRERNAGSGAAGWAVFAGAKALKYWAIGSLGGRWTFRVLVPPGALSTRRGPYRWLRHPNYLAVCGEIAGLALAGGARVAGPVALAGFGVLLARRVRVEERALGAGR